MGAGQLGEQPDDVRPLHDARDLVRRAGRLRRQSGRDGRPGAVAPAPVDHDVAGDPEQPGQTGFPPGLVPGAPRTGEVALQPGTQQRLLDDVLRTLRVGGQQAGDVP